MHKIQGLGRSIHLRMRKQSSYAFIYHKSQVVSLKSKNNYYYKIVNEKKKDIFNNFSKVLSYVLRNIIISWKVMDVYKSLAVETVCTVNNIKLRLVNSLR